MIDKLLGKIFKDKEQFLSFILFIYVMLALFMSMVSIYITISMFSVPYIYWLSKKQYKDASYAALLPIGIMLYLIYNHNY